MSFVRLIPAGQIASQPRGGIHDPQGEHANQATIAWAIGDSEDAPLPCGFGTWHEAQCTPKTLTYDEVILVLEGRFGVAAHDGSRVEGQAGDVIELRKGATVTYFGSHAKIFFVTR